MSFLGIDLGTSGLRTLLIDEDGNSLGAAERNYPTQCPKPGWSEQNPSDWITALESAISELRGRCREFSDLRGIAVAGHMHGATLLDHNGAVIRPCILWNDTRAHMEADALDRIPGLRGISGNIVFPGFTAPKLLWVETHEPRNFARVAKILLPAAFLNHFLTGDYVADLSDSAGTAWLDVGARRWSDTLLKAGHVSLSQMPKLFEGCQPAGILRPELARQWCVGPKVVIAGGAGDNAAAACGIGALNEGEGFLSLGTSGVLLVARDDYSPEPGAAVHTFCHAVPRRWYQMGVMLAAADSLNWLSAMVGRPPADLTAALGEKLISPGRVQFLPYLSGERTPHNDARIRGGFTGLGKDTDRQDLTRAVLEGVAFGLRDSQVALAGSGAEIRCLRAIGGGARSRYWLRLIATVLDVSLELPSVSEYGAAFGAARLAMIAATNTSPESILRPPETAERIVPERSLIDAFDAAYSRFRASYPALRTIVQNP